MEEEHDAALAQEAATRMKRVRAWVMSIEDIRACNIPPSFSFFCPLADVCAYLANQSRQDVHATFRFSCLLVCTLVHHCACLAFYSAESATCFPLSCFRSALTSMSVHAWLVDRGSLCLQLALFLIFLLSYRLPVCVLVCLIQCIHAHNSVWTLMHSWFLVQCFNDELAPTLPHTDGKCTAMKIITIKGLLFAAL